MLGPLAYLDPGTGSLFLQLLLGGVAGFFVVVKLFWKRILGILGWTGSVAEASEATSDSELTVESQDSSP